MYNCIIFSKNRACQCDALLRSIRKYVPDPIVTILVKADDGFKSSYLHMMYDINYHIPVYYDREENFRENTLTAIERHLSKDLTILLTDDSIFFQSIPSSTELIKLMTEENLKTFSTRCGLNTRQQCHWEKNSLQPELVCLYDDGEVIIWDWTKHSYGTDYGRPMSIDGNIFPTQFLYEYLKNTSWNDPRSLDGVNTAGFGNYMGSFRHSRLVNIPANLVCPGHADNWGRFHAYSAEELESKFMSGQVIDLDAMDFSNVYGAHQEIPYVFKKV